MTLTEKPAAPSEPSARVADPVLGWATVLMGIGAAVVAVLGPLVIGVIEYHASAGAVNQIVGGDVAGLFLVAPLSLLAGILVLRGRPAGRVLAMGPALYALYMYSQLALGSDVTRYPGNSERFFPLFLALFVLAGGVALRSWVSVEPTHLPRPGRGLERVIAVYLLVVAAFLTIGLHLPGLVDAWSGQPASTEYLADPVVFWLVKFMDLGIVVPLMVTVGITVFRQAAWADKAVYPAAAWAGLLGSSVAGMAIVMQTTGDPAGTVANTVAFGAFALVALSLAWLVHRPLLVRSGDRSSAR